MRSHLVATTVASFLLCSCFASSSGAETVPANGYIYTRTVLDLTTEGCVAQGNGGVYVGVGSTAFPATGGTRSILFLSPGFAVRTIATGLNILGDCVFDGKTNTLYVTDNGGEYSGATTGDTVFAIPGSPASPIDVAGLEVLPAGSIPYAFSVALTDTGLLVSDAAGGGNGEVIAIDLTGETPVASSFATDFDYTGGLAVDGDRVLVAEALADFTSAVYAYSPTGTFQETVAGPNYSQGSIDIDVTSDGHIVATGSPTLVSIDAGGAAAPLVTGLNGGTQYDAFGGGVSVDFGGRIDFLASSFSGADDDKSVHSLVPVDRLVRGGGNAKTDCVVEWTGVKLVPRVPGGTAKSAICTDGDACDGDGRVNGECIFPLGLCVNVVDPRLPDCEPTAVASVPLSLKSESGELSVMISQLNEVMPIADSTCVYSAGFHVPVRTLANGGLRPGKTSLKTRATTADEEPRTDTDVLRFQCNPGATS